MVAEKKSIGIKKTYPSIRIGFSGFEFSHHPYSIEKALNELKKEQINLELIFWSARDGIESEVRKFAPACKFIESEGPIDVSLHEFTSKVDANNLQQLSELELKHFSYTYSRYTFFRDPRVLTIAEKEKFTRWLNLAIAFLEKKKIEALFFIKMPHNLLDVSLFYAATRLKINTLYTEGPFFGNYLSLNEKGGNLNVNKECEPEMRDAFFEMMRKRNLSNHLDVPAYMKKDHLGYLPNIPTPITPVYESFFERKVASITRSNSLAKLSGKLVRKFILFYHHYYLNFRISKYATDLKTLPSSYILVLLQYHPEQTSSPAAKDTPFEEERIIKLARAFPQFDIVVREHPSNLKSGLFHQYRSEQSLIRMLSENNVLYVWPNSRQEYFKILRNANFTVSTSGTVALESIQLRVPSAHFSDSFAKGMPGIFCVKEVDDIKTSEVEQTRTYLKSLSNKELVSKAYDAFKMRPSEKAFLCGYHTADYKPENYVNDAAKLMRKLLKIKFEKAVNR